MVSLVVGKGVWWFFTLDTGQEDVGGEMDGWYYCTNCVCTHIHVHTHSWYYHGTCVTTDIQEMSTI